ncbi:ribonuclease Z [Orbus sturtevantii]|uniref:ribonuclease Z n=1 Tax=Orbus sturtevantii TaxID=3074109 RepID=UPI00370DBE85
MKLFFLGTSAGTITAERNVSALVLDLIKERNSLWLFDCGEATQHQMLKAKLSIARLEKIFITHLHGDHLFGLPGVLTTRSLMQNMSPLTLYGPKGIKQFVETVVNISHSWLTYPLDIVEIDQPTELINDEQFVVNCDALNHRVACFGYRIVEKERSPKLNIEKLNADGIPNGSHLAALKLGQLVQLTDGRMINGSEYWGEIKRGRKLAILGDTMPCDAAVKLAHDVNVLVHEATQKSDLQEKANNRGHSTTHQAAEIALKSGAKKLIITHISPRYSLANNLAIVNECRQIFANTEIASDFYQVEI